MKKNSVNGFPVSRKFYEGLRERVRSIVISVTGIEDTDIIKQVMMYIDDYIREPREDYTLWVRGYRAPEIIFYSLRGEIDRALDRSRRARARAAARRAARAATETSGDAFKEVIPETINIEVREEVMGVPDNCAQVIPCAKPRSEYLSKR